MTDADRQRHWSLHPVARFASWILIVLAVGAAVELLLIMLAGGEWTRGVHAKNPASRLLFIVLFALGAYCLGKGARNTKAQWKEFAGSVALAVFSTAFALLLAEVGLRAFLAAAQNAQSIQRLKPGQAPPMRKVKSRHPLAAIVQRSPNAHLIFELRSNLDMDFGHRILRTNGEGMRDSKEYPVERRPNSVRIIGLGDSGMFGWACDQDEDYTAVLEEMLNRRKGGVLYEVLNMAVPGYNTELEVEALRSKGLAYRPDIVIVGWCDNDTELPFFVPQRGQWTRTDALFLYYLLFDRRKYGDLVLGQVRELKRTDKSRIPARVRKGSELEGVRRAFENLKAMGEKEGFEILVFGPIRPEVVALLKDVGLRYLDLLERIPLDKYPAEYSLHQIHPRPEGHRIRAEYLLRELDELGWLKPKAQGGGGAS